MRALRCLYLCLLLGGCGGGGGSNPPAPQPGSLGLSVSTLAVDESAGTATLNVVRSGGSEGAVSVTLASSDGSAVAGQDYTRVTVTVTFAAGDAAAKAVTVPITNDVDGEDDETLSLALSAPTGGASLAATASAALTIRDNDKPGAPTLGVAGRMRQLLFSWTRVPGATTYRLSRDPDGQSGFSAVGADHPAQALSAALDISVHRHNWVHALYRLEACNAFGCTPSASSSALDAMVRSIGYFKASSVESEDFFGAAVALSADGRTLAVGATGDRDGDQTIIGAVYVFHRTGSTWAQQAYLRAADADADDSFGFSMGLSADGNTLAVAAPFEDSLSRVDEHDEQGDNAGALYVYVRQGAQWHRQAYLKAANLIDDTQLGWALDLSSDGNVLAAGALNDAMSGAVHVFERVDGQWQLPQRVVALNAEAGDGFGRAVALSADGNVLAVGAPYEDSNAVEWNGDAANNSATDSGAVYVFSRAGGWQQRAYLKASNTEPNATFAADAFGYAVDLSADGRVLAVGAPFEDSVAAEIDGDSGSNDALDAGAVYVVVDDGTQWTYDAYIKPSNAQSADNFGIAVQLSADGRTLATGAWQEDSIAAGIDGNADGNGAPEAGCVFLFENDMDLWRQQRYVKASNTRESQAFGFSLALTADASTLAVGAPVEDSNSSGVDGAQDNIDAPQAGAVYLY